MRMSWRWLVSLAGLAIFVAAPTVVGAVPAHRSALTVAELVRRADASAATGYSGYAESTGSANVPVVDQFGSLADLFGGTADLRVWWRSTQQWRVDSINVTGEKDVHTDRTGSWTWDYERNTATRTPPDQGMVRLPRSSDLLPTELGRRLLSEALPAELSALAPERIAGRSAAGIRIRPAARQSTVRQVDVWLDPATGLPLRVKLYDSPSGAPFLSTTFLDFSPHPPAVSEIAFTPSANATIVTGSALDLAGEADRLVHISPPGTLAGLARNKQLSTVGSVGVYGRGVTELVALPLPTGVARSLQAGLVGKPGVVRSDMGLTLGLGPVNMFLSSQTSLSNDGQRVRWLLAGSVTPATVRDAAAQLAAAQ